MLTVNLDGQNFQFDASARNINEIIELAKKGIASGRLISDLKLSGRDISGMEYKLPLRAHKDVVLEISTQTKGDFIHDKFVIAGLSLDVIIARFNMISPSFEEQGILEASQHLSSATKDFQFFLSWFSDILGVDTERFATLQSDLTDLVRELSVVLNETVSHQSAGDWEAVNTSIDGKVVPLLITLAGLIKGANA